LIGIGARKNAIKNSKESRGERVQFRERGYVKTAKKGMGG